MLREIVLAVQDAAPPDVQEKAKGSVHDVVAVEQVKRGIETIMR